jgi:hypothetical protein
VKYNRNNEHGFVPATTVCFSFENRVLKQFIICSPCIHQQWIAANSPVKHQVCATLVLGSNSGSEEQASC